MASRREYEMLFQLNAQVGSSYSSAFSKAQAQVSAMQQKIVDLGKTQGDIAAYQKQQSAIEATRKKLETLQQQYDNIQKEIDETGEFSSDLQNKLLSKQVAIEKTSAALEQQTQKAEQTGAALADAGVDTKNLAAETDRLTAEIQDLKEEQQSVIESAEEMGNSGAEAIQAYQEAIVASGLQDALRAIYDEIQKCTEASIEYESAITGVYKTVDGSEQQLAAISEEIKELATQLPATTTEIAGVAEAAGQLGIATDDIMTFTEVMINLGESTNLTADEAATALAKFSNITGTTAAEYSRLGSVIVDLGNNFATTEADIVSMATRLASAGTLAGLTEPEIMALAAAMSSVGIEAEAGGTAMTQTLSAIEEAVASGGDDLYEFARIAGMSADEFAAAWNTSPIQAIQAFISGIGQLDQQGESATLVLDELGLSGIRQSDMLKRLGLAADTLTESIATANNAWIENTALTEEVAKRYATTASQQAMMENAFNNLKIAVGDNFTPALRELYGVTTDVTVGLTDFVELHPEIVKGLTTAGGVIGAATIGITGYTAAIKIAKVAQELFTSTIPGVGTIMAVTTAVAALAGVMVTLSETENAETAAVREMTEASREDYFQLQVLRSEYESACEMYGETSDQAMYLAWQIDELNESFESNKQSLSEYIEECQAANDSLLTMLDTNRNAYLEIGTSENTTLALVARLQELASQTDQTVETQEEMKAIIAELNGIVPELALSYEDVVGGVTDYAAAIESTVKAQAAAERYQAAQSGMVAALNAQYEAETQLTERSEQQAAAQERYNAAFAAYMTLVENTSKMGGDNPFSQMGLYVTSEYKELCAAEEAYKAYTAQVEESQGILDQATTDYEEYMAAMVGYVESTMESGDTTALLNERINETKTAMDALAEAYTLAYNAAYESVAGQYALWDEAAEVVATSAETINTGLESQITYWQDYNANLQSLGERSKDIEGLSDMIATFADGSTDSINAVAGMAAANDEELAAMVANWQTLQAEHENVANSIAELNTNFTAEMDALQAQLAADIEAMDLGTEAAASGRNTIQGFIDGGTAMLPAVEAAYARIAQAAMAAIDNTLDINSPSREMEYRAEMTWAGYINQTKAMEPDVVAAMSEAASLGAKAVEAQVASESLLGSTTLAEASVATEPSTLPPIHVTVNVAGNADEATVEEMKDVTEELVAAVLDAIDDREHDQRRSAYF